MGIKSSIEFWYARSEQTQLADDWLTIVFEFPAVHALRHNSAVSREIMWKWRPPVEADDRKVGDLHVSLISLTVVVQAWFLHQK